MVIVHHPKMVERWARIYISIGKKEGPDAAKAWAYRVLSEDSFGVLKEKVVELLARDG